MTWHYWSINARTTSKPGTFLIRSKMSGPVAEEKKFLPVPRMTNPFSCGPLTRCKILLLAPFRSPEHFYIAHSQLLLPRLHSSVLKACILNGGVGVKPFKYYLDVGVPPHLSIAEDIKFIFYHLLMKRAETQSELLQMNLAIPFAEIPTVMRICGHFPSELEASRGG